MRVKLVAVGAFEMFNMGMDRVVMCVLKFLVILSVNTSTSQDTTFLTFLLSD